MIKLIPILNWLPRYRKPDFKGDLSAGITVAVMLIPQGMAYGLLAGVPPIYGLYAALIPALIYPIFGSSRQLAVGPAALISIMVASGLQKFAVPESAEYIRLAAILAALVGLILLSLGIARLGFVANFLPYPVISGFTSAAALIIGFSQLKHLLGISLPRSANFYTILWNTLLHIRETHVQTLLIGIACIILLIAIKRWKPLFPGELLVVVFSAALVWGFRLDLNGVNIVGEVPRGLPSPSMPSLNWDKIELLLPTALAISLVGFTQSIAVAKAFAMRNGYTVDANQELISLGISNCGAGLFGAFPVAGGFARTAVNAQAGARTGIASVITAAVIALTLFLLTRFFFYLPTAMLAAIIMVAVFGLVDLKEARRLWKVKRTDFGLLLFAFLATLILGIELGIMLSVAASLLVMIRRTARPNTAILGRLPGTEVYRNIERYPEAVTFENLVIFRIDAALYFGNAEFLKERLQEICTEKRDTLQAIILDFQSVNDVDATADRVLKEIMGNLRSMSIELYISNLKGFVRDVLERSGFYEELGRDHFFINTHDAVNYFLKQSH